MKATEAPDDAEATKSIIELLDSMDSYFPIPKRDVELDFIMPVEDVFSISGRGTVATDLRTLLPEVVIQSLENGLPLMNNKWRGKFLDNAILHGPETRGSSPVRIVRDRETYQSPSAEGLYPVGEGAGFAGGIISAAVDGLRAAKAIIGKHAPLSSPNQN